MKRLLAPTLVILLLGQAAGAIHGALRPVRLSAPEQGPRVVERTDRPGEERTLGRDITIDDARWLFEQGDAVVFVDARLADEFEAGHIAGAFHLDPLLSQGEGMGTIADNFPAEQRMVVYCGGGDCDASKVVVNELSKRGFTGLHIMVEGFPAWVEAGLPTEAGAGEAP